MAISRDHSYNLVTSVTGLHTPSKLSHWAGNHYLLLSTRFDQCLQRSHNNNKVQAPESKTTKSAATDNPKAVEETRSGNSELRQLAVTKGPWRTPGKSVLASMAQIHHQYPLTRQQEAPVPVTAEQLWQCSRVRELQYWVDRCQRFLARQTLNGTNSVEFTSAGFPGIAFSLQRDNDSQGWQLLIQPAADVDHHLMDLLTAAEPLLATEFHQSQRGKIAVTISHTHSMTAQETTGLASPKLSVDTLGS